MPSHRTTTLCLLVSAAVVAGALPAGATAEVTTRRLGGADRYGTAAAIARVTFPGRAGSQSRVSVAGLARGDAFADALASVNAIDTESPLLLTSVSSLPAPTSFAMRDLGVGTAVIMGQTDVVSAQVENQLKERGVTSERIAGRDRYETARLAYERYYNFEAKVPGLVDGLRTAFLTSGVQFADAMTAGPVAARQTLPLLLTAPDSLPTATRTALAYDGFGRYAIEQVVVVGGAGAVSDRVVRQLRGLGLVVRRVAGSTRQETAVRVFEFAEQEFGWTLAHVNLARGDGFADAVAGGPHGGRERAPTLLTAGVDDLGTVTRDFLRARSSSVGSLDVSGDRAAVSDAVVTDAARAATSP
jgi:putative cell wall-binding protein